MSQRPDDSNFSGITLSSEKGGRIGTPMYMRWHRPRKSPTTPDPVYKWSDIVEFTRWMGKFILIFIAMGLVLNVIVWAMGTFLSWAVST